jgi:hypothetical protein
MALFSEFFAEKFTQRINRQLAISNQQNTKGNLLIANCPLLLMHLTCKMKLNIRVVLYLCI